jgi:hypothetical protein
MLDSNGREAIMYLWQLQPTTENTKEARMIVGESAARQLTMHTNMELPTGFSYRYTSNFEYAGDDGQYGPVHRPLAHHLLNEDAFTVYINQFQNVNLAQEDSALMDIFGTVTDETRALAARGGTPAFNPGPYYVQVMHLSINYQIHSYFFLNLTNIRARVLKSFLSL